MLWVPLLWSIPRKYGQQIKPLKKCLSYWVAGHLKSSAVLLIKKTPQNFQKLKIMVRKTLCSLLLPKPKKTKKCFIARNWALQRWRGGSNRIIKTNNTDFSHRDLIWITCPTLILQEFQERDCVHTQLFLISLFSELTWGCEREDMHHMKTIWPCLTILHRRNSTFISLSHTHTHTHKNATPQVTWSACS